MIRNTISRLAIPAAFLLLLFWIPRWLLIEPKAGPFFDEIYNVLAPLNFFRFGLYSPVASATIGYEESVSSGIVSTFPAALGWIFGGTLFSARLAFMIWNVGLLFTFGYLNLRRWLGLPRSHAFFFSALFIHLLFSAVPYSQFLVTQLLGEITGAALLLGAMYFFNHNPKWSAIFVGVMVWHAKFIYLPFGIAILIGQSKRGKLTTSAREFLRLILIAQVPLILWWLVIVVTAGPLAFWTYMTTQVKVFFYFLLGYSSVSDDFAKVPIRGLWNRLESRDLEWHFYDISDKIKILALTLGSLVTLIGSALATIRKREGKPLTRILFALGVIAFAVWYFWFHHKMWIRHFDGALFVGFGVIVFWLMKEKWGRALLASISIAVLGKESIRTMDYLRTKDTKEYVERYSKKCKSENPRAIENLKMIELCIERAADSVVK